MKSIDQSYISQWCSLFPITDINVEKVEIIRQTLRSRDDQSPV